MENFRPNLVVAGGVAHQEDLWEAVELQLDGGDTGIGGSASMLRLKVTGPCARCSMVNIDHHQQDHQQQQRGRGETDGAKPQARASADAVVAPVLKTLASYRRDKSNIYFGQFLAFDDAAATAAAGGEPLWLRTGMPVRACRRSEATAPATAKTRAVEATHA